MPGKVTAASALWGCTPGRCSLAGFSFVTRTRVLGMCCLASPPACPRQLPKPATICDGLEARLGSLTWPIVRDRVDDVITITEEEVVAAMQLVMERMKVRAVPAYRLGSVAGAVTLGRSGRKAARRACQVLPARPRSHLVRQVRAPAPDASPAFRLVLCRWWWSRLAQRAWQPR